VKFKKLLPHNRCFVETGSRALREVEVLASTTFALCKSTSRAVSERTLSGERSRTLVEVGKAETHKSAVQSYPCSWHS
jgi:hypothetical protein